MKLRDASTTNTIAAKLNETKQTQLTKETTACRGLGRPTTPVSLPDGSLAIVNLGTNMKTKTSELTGAALDWAVAKCIGHRVAENYGSYIRIYLPDLKQSGYTLAFCPSTDWSQGGPIIEREGIELLCESLGFCWVAIPQKGPEWRGPTPLIAAMRCYVASKLGAEVDVPELLEG